MATGTLTGSTIASTYKSILKVKGGANTVLDADPQLIEDGDGNDSVLGISTDSVLISGSGTRLDFNTDGSGEYLSGDGNDLTIASGRDIKLVVASGGSVFCAGGGGTGNTVYGEDAGLQLASDDDYNVFIGKSVAIANMTDANYNIGIGYLALSEMTTASNIIAIGANAVGGATAVGSDTNGTVAIGHDALKELTSGQGNVAIGYQAQAAQTDGGHNTVIGYQALDAADSGESNNVVIGSGAGGAINASGTDDNVFIGYNAGLGGTSNRADNVAIGSGAWDANVDIGGSENVFIGKDSGGGTWASAGSDGNTAIGWGTMAGAMNSAAGNVAVGTQALAAVTTAHDNIAIGFQTMDAMQVGQDNVAIGRSAMGDANHADADSNVVIGTYAGDAFGTNAVDGTVLIGREAGSEIQNSTASYTVAIGKLAASSLTSGAGNTAVGYQAAATLQTGANNTALGYQAMDACHINTEDCVAIGKDAMGGSAGGTRSYRNVAIGMVAMGSAALDGANYNVALGYSALANLTSGDDNIAIGLEAGNSISSGYENVVIGTSAGNHGIQITTGYRNTLIGTACDSSAINSVNCIGIGYDCNVTSSNIAMIGNGDITELHAADDTGATLYAGSATVQTSDRRIKENFKDLSIGLDFINQLNPVEYNKKQPSDYEDSLKKNLSWYKSGRNPRVLDDVQKSKSRVGFIAQDVGDVLKDLGFDDNNDIVDINDDTTLQHIAYSKIVAPLVKAVQELSAKVKALEDAQ